MTRPVSFFRRVTIILELYRENWQGGNMYVAVSKTAISGGFRKFPNLRDVIYECPKISISDVYK